ncbi:Fic family protein [Cupriavidus gilardii]|uniref:Fic family protein n=1 Tax=Cupriavidus gilardii TaxID=82541 RepID=UPI0015801499|nr:Fic family protein [Cupriavidus gilardii]MCT9123048.1 Fic family protein [Cupriavidus gilardii]QKS63680.1 Fic family protein [Cupriavidus gilardii]
MTAQSLGYKWLSDHYRVVPVQDFQITSALGPARRTVVVDGRVQEIYPATAAQPLTLRGQLSYALRHEGVHLEFLSRLFEVLSVEELSAWLAQERTGQYARRAGFLYEWLTGRKLPDACVATAGNYVDAISSDDYFAAVRPVNNPRWRVRDNLPGTPEFCPLVRRTGAIQAAEKYDCAAALEELNAEFGHDVLMRSAVWLTIKESRASFAIEHEQDQRDRIRRFAAVMERRIGQYPRLLSPATLAELQQEIVSDRSTLSRFGLRSSPVFVGETHQYEQIVHYIAPHWERVPGMLTGVEAFLERTVGKSSVVRAGAAAFGFVFIHPLADGNGRIHRFLVNDVLRRDGAVPKPFVLPISAVITEKPQNVVRYDEVLEQFSAPLMARYSDRYAFKDVRRKYQDGIESNFEFHAYDDALHAWRFPDLTAQAEYMAWVIDRTIHREMRREADVLREWTIARRMVKDIIDGPDADIDRIIRSVRDNGGVLSNKLRKEFPVLQDPQIVEDLAMALRNAFKDFGGTGALQRSADAAEE